MSALPRLMVAPNGARRGKADHPALPVTVAETVETARVCHEAGADGLHAHVRDAAGDHVIDAGLYRELLTEMARAVPAMQVQVTTEAVGRYTPAQQRAFVRDLSPASVSVALREMCADTDLAAVRRFYHDAADAGVAVQHILYDAADAAHLTALARDGTVPPAPQVLLVLGRYDTRPAEPADLGPPRAALAPLGPIDWAACAFGPTETACLLAAHAAGGKLRVGFENNFHNADGSLAPDNAARVAEIAGLTGRGRQV